MTQTEQLPRPLTVFERVWQDPQEHLFHSEDHGIMAVADTRPKLPLQVVVAPKDGFDKVAHFTDLPSRTRRLLHEVADFMLQKIQQNCTPDQIAIEHIEGRSVTNHPHIVLAAAEPKQGQDLYAGAVLGPLAVVTARELLTLTREETSDLSGQLDQLVQTMPE